MHLGLCSNLRCLHVCGLVGVSGGKHCAPGCLTVCSNSRCFSGCFYPGEVEVGVGKRFLNLPKAERFPL